MKIARKILLYTSLVLVTLLIVSTSSVYIFKDRIIRQFINEANKSLNTPVKIGKVDISVWNDFPNLTIVFTDVYVEDSQPGTYPLLTAKTVSFSMNPVQAWRGNYEVKGLKITESETNLKVSPEGENNYTIVKSKPGAKGESIVFDLRNVGLENAIVRFDDQQSHLHHLFSTEKLTASISLHDDLYDIEADGDLTTGQINTGTREFLKNKTFAIQAKLVYDDNKKSISISPSLFKLDKSSFELKGTYQFSDKNLVDFVAVGKNTDIHTLLSLMPEEISRKAAAYQSKGEVYLTLKLKGEISDKKSPFISVAFGCRDVRVFHPDYKSTIEHASMEGSFASASLTDLSRAELFLKKIKGELNGKTFEANFSMDDFDNPLVTFDFKGDLDAGSILGFYPVPEIKKLSGAIHADVSFQGRISLLKKKSTAQQVRAQGSIDMKDIEMTAGKQNIHFKNVAGSLQFNNNDLALSDVSGQFENSDFRLNGFFKNVITFLLFENQPIGIETDLRSDFLDLDQLFSIGFSEKGSGDFNFHISPNLHLNFNCDVKALRYKRFLGREVKGDLLVKNQMAVSRNINLKAMGGSLSLNGIVDAKNPKSTDLVTSIKLNGIHMDSLFYIFENFDQTFIEDKHLKGQTFAELNVEMSLNEKLNLIPASLIADISCVIKNGELNRFEPLQKLNKYLDDEGLSHLRFADLKNDIHIENSTIYIPQMEIRSNVTNISVSGTHTFDQHIDYRVVAPLHSKKKIDKDEAFGAIEDDNTGQSKIFLKIIGTTSKYTIGYDKDAVKKKIRNDLKKEVLELKDAFKNKGKKKKKELELEKEEYFDWDN